MASKAAYPLNYHASPATQDAFWGDEGQRGDTAAVLAVEQLLRRPPTTPEQRLWKALVEDALRDAQRSPASLACVEARAWLQLDDADPWSLTARQCFEGLGLDYDGCLRQLRRVWCGAARAGTVQGHRDKSHPTRVVES